MSKLIKIILIVAFLLVLGFLILNQAVLNKNLKGLQNQKLELNTQQETQEKTINKEESLSQNCIGVVEGSLMFPSEKIPDGMYVCARNIETLEEYCSDQNIESDRFRYKKGYRLEVPKGQYIVAGIYPQKIGSYKIKDSMEFKYIDPNEGCVKWDACDKDFSKFSVECGKTISNIDLANRASADFFRRFFSKEEQLKLEN